MAYYLIYPDGLSFADVCRRRSDPASTAYRMLRATRGYDQNRANATLPSPLPLRDISVASYKIKICARSTGIRVIRAAASQWPQGDYKLEQLIISGLAV